MRNGRHKLKASFILKEIYGYKISWYDRRYERPFSLAQIQNETRKAAQMYKDAMNPDIPTELGERLPRKEDLPKEQKYEKVSEHIVKVNGKYRTVDYPPPP